MPGSDYFLTLAQIALAFVAFSTIVVVFRQLLGGGLSAFQILLVRLFIETGLAAAMFSLVPLLLGFLSLAPSAVWRVSSGTLAIFYLAYFLAYARRRRRVQPGPFPLRIYINFGISIALNLGLWLNAAGTFFEPSIGPYALAVTWLLVQAGFVFIQTLTVFLQRSPRDRRL